MPITLEEPRPVIPTVKLLEKKHEIIAHIVDQRVMPVTIFGSQGAPKLRDDGKQVTQDKVVLQVIKGTAQVKDVSTEQMRTVVPGEPVTIWFQGHRRWAWILAKREHGAISVGDVVRIVYTGDEPGKGAQPKKVWGIQIRAGNPERETAAIAACEALYHQLNQATSEASGPDDDGPWPEEPEEDIPF